MACLKHMSIDEVFHIDGAHGTVKNKYSVDIFDESDQHGTLHPVAFMIASF